MLETKKLTQGGELGQGGQDQPTTSAPVASAAGSDESVGAPTKLRFNPPDWAYDPAVINASIQRGYRGN